MDVYLFCSTPQKDIRARIEEDTGVKIKKVINSVDKIKPEYEMVLFIDDGGIPLDFSFRKEDVILVEDLMTFKQWLSFYNSGVDVICYKDNFYELLDHFLTYGVETKVGAGSTRGILNKKNDIMNAIKSRNSKVISLFPLVPDDLTSLSFNLVNSLSNEKEHMSIAVLDFDFMCSALNFHIRNSSEFKLIDSGNSYLDSYNMKTYRNDGVYFITYDFMNKGNLISDKKDVYINIIHSIVKHFDVIFINLPYMLSKDILSTFSICTDLVIYLGDNPYYTNKGLYLYKNVYKELFQDNKVKVLGNADDENIIKIGEFSREIRMWEDSDLDDILNLLKKLNLIEGKKHLLKGLF